MTNLLYGDASGRASLTQATSLGDTDFDDVTQGGVEKKVPLSLRAAYFRAKPAGSRTIALTGSNTVQLTATDHDKNVYFSGTSGTLTGDGTLTDGFRCHLISGASGSLTWGSGLTGLLSSTALTSGATGKVMMVGSTIWAGVDGGTGTLPTATAYTTQITDVGGTTLSSITTGTTVYYKLTPTSGAWPAGDVLTPTLSGAGITGTFSPTTSGTLSANSTPITFSITPVGAGTATLNSSATTTTGGALANSTGAQTLTVNAAAATSFTTAPTTVSVAIGAGTNLTSTPNGAWQSGQTYTLTPATVTGTFASVSGCTVSGTTVTPTVGSSSPAVVAFTATGTAGTGTIAIAGTGITATTTSIAVTTTSSIYPTIPNVTRRLVLDAGAGVTGTTDITAWANQVGTGTFGRTVANSAAIAAQVNSRNTIQFAGFTESVNSGLFDSSPPSFLSNLLGDVTISLAFYIGASVPGGQVFRITKSPFDSTQFLDCYFWSGNTIRFRRAVGASQEYAYVIPTLNTLHKMVITMPNVSGGALKVWDNQSTTTPDQAPGWSAQGNITGTPATIAIGQDAQVSGSSSNNNGMQTPTRLCQVNLFSGIMAPADVATEMAALTTLWGS